MSDPTANNALLLDAAGVCAKLSIGLSHFHNLRRAGRMPLEAVRLGKSVRFRASELDAWVAAGAPSADRWRAMNLARRSA